VARRPDPGQAGMAALLEGRKMDIKPAGFDETHRRGREGEHRLSADEAKWQPYGVGDEGEPAEPIAEEGAAEVVSEEKSTESVVEVEAT